MRHLDENARAVAGIGLAAAGAAVVQVQQHLQGLLDDRVGLPALDVDDEPDAAGLVLELRVVKALFGRGMGPRRLAAIIFTVRSDRHFLKIGLSALILVKFR